MQPSMPAPGLPAPPNLHELTPSHPLAPHPTPPDYLEGTLELDAACKIKKASEEAALIFGQPAAALVGEHVQKVRRRC